MRPLTFTRYTCMRDTWGTSIARPWSEWVGTLSTHALRPCDPTNAADLDRTKDGPAIVLGDVDGRRAAKNVRGIDAVAADIDAATEDAIAAALARVADVEWLLHTTHSHRAPAKGGGPRIRVIFPLSSSARPEDAHALWSGLDALLGHGVIDPATKDAARLHFLPSTYDLAVAEVAHNVGRWLTPTELLAPIAGPSVDLDAVRSWLVRQRVDDLKPVIRGLLDGVPFAVEGERHRAVLALTWRIAARFPDLDDNDLGALFAPSLAAMSNTSSDAPTIARVCAAYRGAVAKADAVPGVERYTDDDLARIAAVHGWQPADLARRWLVMSRDAAVWLLDVDGVYRGPIHRDTAQSAAVAQYLARAPMRLTSTTSSGSRRRRSIVDLVGEHGILVDDVAASLSAQRTTITGRTLIEAVRPRRTDLVARHDPDIARWLDTLGGSRLVDWLSVVPDLDLMLCALYLCGPRRCGKTLLAHGIASLWSDAPADISDVLGSFNDALLRCPIVLADEEIPRQYQRQSVTSLLRTLLSTHSRTLNRKYLNTTTLTGCVRLILAANHAHLLVSGGVMTSNDLAAIAERFLFVDVGIEAAVFLDGVPAGDRERWRERGIAEHVLWLAENHVVTRPGARFVVEGSVTRMHRLLLTGSRYNALVCEWLVRYLLNPTAIESDRQAKPMVSREGALLVNDQLLGDKWQTYLRHTTTEPEARLITLSLAAIADPKAVRRRVDGVDRRYRKIDLDVLADFADGHNLGDRATLYAAVDATPPTVVDVDDTVH